MIDILELAAMCTSIVIKPTYEINKDNTVRLASVDAHIAVKGSDNCIQYADIHSVAETTEKAIARCLKIALAYKGVV
jgi:hypothetical protein